MTDLSLAPTQEIIVELKRRNLSFLIAYCDHAEFMKSAEQGIVWGCDSGGNLVLQVTLLRFLTTWLDGLVKHHIDPPVTDD